MNIFRNKSIRQLVANFRNEYLAHGIDEHCMRENPIDQFESWFEDAAKSKIPEPNAFTLSTVTAEGKPAGRVILLKGFDENGFVFFTNYQSRKGHELLASPHAAITFLWLELFRQVRIEGTVTKVSDDESEDYFKSRPRTSQIGSWVSEQSKHLHSRKELDDRYKEAEKLFEGKPIARPAHWGGYRLKPVNMEFWQGRASRLHDRILYTRHENGIWSKERLFP